MGLIKTCTKIGIPLAFVQHEDPNLQEKHCFFCSLGNVCVRQAMNYKLLETYHRCTNWTISIVINILNIWIKYEHDEIIIVITSSTLNLIKEKSHFILAYIKIVLNKGEH